MRVGRGAVPGAVPREPDGFRVVSGFTVASAWGAGLLVGGI